MRVAVANAPTGIGTRSIGVVYLLYFGTAFLGGWLLRGLVVHGDAAATAAAIAEHAARYRSGLSVGLLANALYIALAALFYRLFAPVDRDVSLVAAFVGLAGCTVQLAGGVLQAAPLVFLGVNAGVGEVGARQMQVASLLGLELYAEVFNVSLVLFAVYDLLIGYLVVRSTFLPKALGALMILAGLGWMTFAWPPLAAALSGVVLPFGALAELVLAAWLVVRAPRVGPASPVS